MKTSKSRQFLALILAAIMMLCCIPAASAAQIPEEEPLDPMGQPVNGEYVYFASILNGHMLRGNASSIFTQQYSSTSNVLKWYCVYHSVSNGHALFSFRPYNYASTKALTVNPTTKEVTVADIPAAGPTQYQKWYVDSSSEHGYYLRSGATDTAVRGKALRITDSGTVNRPDLDVSTNGTLLAILNDPITPPNPLISPSGRIYLTPGETYQIDAEAIYSDNATEIPGVGMTKTLWFNYSSNMTSILSVNTLGVVTALAPGSTYVYVSNKVTGGGAYVMITVLPIANGTYCIRNPETAMVIAPTSTPVVGQMTLSQTQWSYYEGQFWNFVHVEGEYYTIEHAADSSGAGLGYYVSTDTGFGVDGLKLRSLSVIQQGSFVYKWKLVSTSAGNYKFVPEGSTSVVLSIRQDGDDYDAQRPIQMQTYTNDSNYLDEWQVQS